MMYYISIDPEDANKLIYYCRVCGNKDESAEGKNISISKMQLVHGEQKFAHMINKHTKFDPTLPRVKHILCPNDACDTNKDTAKEEDREILYMRYDEMRMKYVYICGTCDIVWKIEDTK